MSVGEIVQYLRVWFACKWYRLRDWYGGRGFHYWRWRFLTAWCVIVTLVGAGALRIDRQHASDQADKMCRTVDAFAGAELQLRSAEGRAAFVTIGLKQEVIAAAARAVDGLTEKPVPGADATVLFFQAENTLQRADIASTRVLAASRAKASNLVRRLKLRLGCVE